MTDASGARPVRVIEAFEAPLIREGARAERRLSDSGGGRPATDAARCLDGGGSSSSRSRSGSRSNSTT